MTEVTEITTRDESSGRYHHRYVVNGRTVVDERCNLDQAGAYHVMSRGTRADRGDGVPVGTDPALLCQYCFPPHKDDEAVG